MAEQSRYILSVDVEDYFQVEAFAKVIPRSDWDSLPSRVVANTYRVLDLFDAYSQKGTFFTLGWVAAKFPALVREIHARGHELASHSFWHRPIFSLTPEVFRDDLRQSRDAIEQASGVRVVGYRAPSWSITAQSLWALDILAEEGFLYDSSIFPIRHDIYGIPGAKRFPYQIKGTTARPSKGLMEFPPATARVFGQTLPSAGGGYLRILPMWYTRWALQSLEREGGRVLVVYFHPWEIDPEQPRIAAQLKSRIRHYTNLQSMESRLRRLMSSFPFEPFCNLAESGVRPATPAASL